ncbi:hypothetical protein WICPIJ_005242 [Wickerhamomyces pijperi]|uniref:Tyrosine--tRNA ligase n=1 Tax=Wickerhamomyces pijperi TaxID=599730 RepID=A0A9P8Q492_WICPI|nr:hypothetical protein WICPIJ_005242 [Wickerhamomyces pijperi]
MLTSTFKRTALSSISRSSWTNSIRAYARSSESIKDIQQQLQTFSIDPQHFQTELNTNDLLSLLKDRGLIANNTAESDLSEILEKGAKLGLYCGADPSARSLHLGNLLPLMLLLHFNIRGHSAFTLVGGATGEVGDPSGRATERDAMQEEVRLENVKRIKQQMESFVKNGSRFVKSVNLSGSVIEEGPVEAVNNLDWWKDVTLLKFLSTYGRFIRVSSMLARDSVKDRLTSEAGIGFNEFTYQILQAFDFYYLFKTNNVSIQLGGNDQWGNITAGIDFINRVKPFDKKLAKKTAFGITVPLLTTASGAKFGKSAGNAVFIDREMTPSFEIYQYFIKAQDSEVAKLLKIFTFIPLAQIETIMAKHNEDPSFRYAQRILAEQVTDLIHGVGSGKNANIITSILYPFPDEAYPDISTDSLVSAFKSANILKTLGKDQFFNKPYSVVLSEVQQISRNEAKKLIKQGGVYQGFNRVRIDESDDLLLTQESLIDERVLLLRVGKGKYHMVEFV